MVAVQGNVLGNDQLMTFSVGKVAVWACLGQATDVEHQLAAIGNPRHRDKDVDNHPSNHQRH